VSAPSLPVLLATHWETAWALDALALAVVWLYIAAARRGRSRWPRHRTLSFLAGIACVLVALQSGIGAYDDRLLSDHMVQHMLLLLVAPPLLLGGRPLILALRAISPAARARPARALTRVQSFVHPVACLAVFTLIVLGTHVPPFYDATLRHPLLHDAEHAAYVLAGLALYWPLVGGEPVVSRQLSGVGRLIYMLAAMPAMAAVGAYLNRHATLVYAGYGPAGRALGISPLADQAQAGAIMWVAGGVIVTAAGIWAALSGLIAEERRQQLADARAAIGPGGTA
jgi:putative copper resistance protein D